MATQQPPREHLDRRARTLWRITALVAVVPIVLAAAAVAYVLNRLERLSLPAVALAALIIVLAATFAVWPYPDLLWRRWRYEIGETEVDLQHGWWTVTRSRIPMSRIQHVDTRRGPLQRRFGLASVVLYTAAGAEQIPALADDAAAQVRDRIAALANVYDDL